MSYPIRTYCSTFLISQFLKLVKSITLKVIIKIIQLFQSFIDNYERAEQLVNKKRRAFYSGGHYELAL